MPGALPLLLAGGAAAVLLGGKKKSKKAKKKSLAGQPCEVAVGTPDGYICEDGTLRIDVIDEDDLEKDEEPTGEEVGEFETKEEDVSLTEGEEAVVMTAHDEAPAPDPALMCEEFLQAIHIVPTEAGELPINKIAAEQTAIPTMKATMLGIHQNLGGKTVDAESVGPIMVQNALSELIPVCEWKYDEQADEFLYNDGRSIESAIGKEVLFALMALSVQLIDDFNNQEEDLPQPGFNTGDAPQAGFSVHKN